MKKTDTMLENEEQCKAERARLSYEDRPYIARGSAAPAKSGCDQLVGLAAMPLGGKLTRGGTQPIRTRVARGVTP